MEISPVPLNQGERRFVEELKAYCESSPALLQDTELYLLRNLSKGRGVGFFEAGNFHPDFIVWLIAEGQEYISFVDPKGIRNLGAQDPKIQFHRTIKEIEERLGDSTVTLNSFVISNTPAHEMQLLWGVDKAQMEAWHVLFQQQDKDRYIDMLLTKGLQGSIPVRWDRFPGNVKRQSFSEGAPPTAPAAGVDRRDSPDLWPM